MELSRATAANFQAAVADEKFRAASLDHQSSSAPTPSADDHKRTTSGNRGMGAGIQIEFPLAKIAYRQRTARNIEHRTAGIRSYGALGTGRGADEHVLRVDDGICADAQG